MKIWLVAVNTYRGLMRGRILLFLILLFVFTFLGYAAGLFYAQTLGEAGAAEQSRSLFAYQIENLLEMYTDLAYLLALIAAVYVLPGEIKSGTIVPTLGRSVSRGQYLLGLFAGLNLLLLTYVGLTALSIGGLLLWSGLWPPWGFLLGAGYFILTINLFMAFAFFYSTLVGPLLAFVATLITLSLPDIAGEFRVYSQAWSEHLQTILETLFPAWDLFGFSGYLALTRSTPVRDAVNHLVGVVHALDYLAVVLLLSWLVFRRRSLLPNP